MSASRGNVGEHLVMAELLYRGFDAYWADRGNPAFDIACFWNATRRSTRLRVKTTSNHSAVWTVKKSGLIFIDQQPQDDFVAIVDLGRGFRDPDIYLIETPLLEKCLQEDHAFYVSHPKKDGTARKAEQGMRNIAFKGEDRPTDRSCGYQDKFCGYCEAWDSLK